MIELFKKSAPIDDANVEWIFLSFSWALEHFDAQYFTEKTELILLNEDFFPGSFDSAHAMAEGIFERVKAYCGLKHWPFELVQPEHFQTQAIALQGGLNPHQRGLKANISAYSPDYQALTLSYQPQQIKNPDALAASFAHLLAQHQLFQSQLAIPGGDAYANEVTEVMAIMMGFGVFFANTAYTFRGGCGSCYNPAANRQASLSEYNCVYALALFCHLKGLEQKTVGKQLKKHLRSVFKRCYNDVSQRSAQLNAIKALIPA